MSCVTTNGTSHLTRHVNNCKLIPKFHNMSDMILDAEGRMGNKKFDPKEFEEHESQASNNIGNFELDSYLDEQRLPSLVRRGNSPRICKGVKFLQQEKKSKENEQEAYEGQLVGSRKKVDEMLNQTLKRVYNTFYQAVDQLEALRPGVQIIRSQLNPHKVV
ncbi:hypothetical protein KIW84_033406 [Lathyrus oleraceus]|uniref:Uncharacterized protein n=1 Tax=Pisum sativum TaxID=3888 RepID=A0A9D5AXZ5_PEA|nr:hypothetical protein KIW84_033406 [Pisum sativum]